MNASPPRTLDALDSLHSSLEVIGVRGRLAFMLSAHAQLSDPDGSPVLKPFWRAAIVLCEAIDGEATP